MAERTAERTKATVLRTVHGSYAVALSGSRGEVVAGREPRWWMPTTAWAIPMRFRGYVIVAANRSTIVAAGSIDPIAPTPWPAYMAMASTSPSMPITGGTTA